MKIITIITARGGSKGIPSKNIIDFCGKPLIAWSILQARESQLVDEVFVTSDSKEILSVAEKYGATPIKRPLDLSTDTATSEAALLHALNSIAYSPDLLVFLQATSPLRDSKDIDAAINTLLKQNADSLFSAALLDDFCVWTKTDKDLHGLTFDPWNRGRRQDREPLLLENGSIYVFKPSILRENNNRLGGQITWYEMPYWKSHEIDSLNDLDLCTYYFRKHLLNIPRLKINALDLIVYDFDGVMTDNRVLVQQDGTEAVMVNRADGLGVSIIKQLGIPQLILSTEKNPVVLARAKKLNLELIQSCDNKRQALIIYCQEHNYNLEFVAYLGNDINDLEAMRIVGYPIAPADAHAEIKRIAKIVTSATGGYGVIKEFAEQILNEQDD